MKGNTRVLYWFFAGLLGLIFVAKSGRFKRKESTDGLNSNGTDALTEVSERGSIMVSKSDRTRHEIPAHVQSGNFGKTLELSPEVAYQLSVIDAVVAGVGTNILDTLPQYRAERLCLIGNLMLEEIYQEQFRNGGPLDINSNLAKAQLHFYLTNNRVETK